jgi:glutamate synthase (ferredoxin)
VGKDCISPPYHTAFHDVDSMLDFVESLASATGLPVGIKSAVGEDEFWQDLARRMSNSERGVDFITIDGGEGGSGAAPLAFSDHVSLPFKLAFTRVFRLMAEQDLAEKIVFIGAGRLGFPDQANLAVALGCDIVAVAREAMLSIGCIQAQRCHTGHCPTGVATQNPWLVRGLDPTLKSVRLCNYVRTLRKEMLSISRACGAAHPSLLNPDSLEMLDDRFGSSSIQDLFRYPSGIARLSEKDCKDITAIQGGIGS